MPALSDDLYSPAGDSAPGRSLSEHLSSLKRRRWLLIGTFAVLMALTSAVALLLPAVYKSTATILIKEQDIPQELVRSTVTSYADERIQVISQQVLTRATLLELVDRYGLYGRARQRDTSEEIVDRMRRDIKLAPISADVTDRRTGSPAKATIAFTLSFESESPANAQKIAGDLTTLFLNENVKNRQQKAAETTLFLQDELKRVGEHISDVEQQISAFKARNQGRMPDLGLANLMASERAETDRARVDREVTFLSDRLRQLQAQLAETRPQAPLAGGSAGLLEPDERLRALQLQLTTAQSQFSDDHPDVRRLRREIERLKGGVAADGGADDREAALRKVQAELAVLRQRYSDEHPDVVKLRRTVAVLTQAAASAAATPAAPKAPVRADNPAYIALKTQIETTTAQIDALRTERQELQAKQAQLGQRVSQAPEVERELLELVRDLDSSRARFRELNDKSMQAQVAEQLERTRKAERFTLIEPPVFPERPSRPNRQLIFWMGAALAVLGALGAALLREALSGTVGGPRDVMRVLQVPVLAVVPSLPRSSRRRVWLWWALLVTALLIIGAAAGAMHVFYMPLDVAWYGLLRRLGG